MLGVVLCGALCTFRYMGEIGSATITKVVTNMFAAAHVVLTGEASVCTCPTPHASVLYIDPRTTCLASWKRKKTRTLSTHVMRTTTRTRRTWCLCMWWCASLVFERAYFLPFPPSLSVSEYVLVKRVVQLSYVYVLHLQPAYPNTQALMLAKNANIDMSNFFDAVRTSAGNSYVFETEVRL